MKFNIYAVASFVLGIISFVIGFKGIFSYNWVSNFLPPQMANMYRTGILVYYSLIGISTFVGFIGIYKYKKNKQLSGFELSIAGIVLAVVPFVLWQLAIIF